MNMTTTISLLIALSLPSLTRAQPQNSAKDSISGPAREIGEVVVTGTREATDVRHLSQTVSVVGRAKIEQAMQPSLLPVLNEQVPGLFVTARGVMGYGVSGGASGGISIRGLSGGSARLMVLIDGHPQYAGIFGHPIADAYQTLLADKMEVLRGPASVIYGSNAMGGVVNIVTRRMHDDGVRTDAHLGYGSYNTLETELTNRVRKGRFASVVSGSYNRTDGHRRNMGFEQYGGYAKLGFAFSNNWRADADVNITRFNAHCPGPVSAPLLDAYQEITRGVASLAVEDEFERTSGSVRFFRNWGKHWINDGYAPSTGGTPQDGRFNSQDDMTGVSAYQSVRFPSGTRATLGIDWFRYGGEAWTKYVKGEREGTRSDLVDKHEDELAAYVDLRQDVASVLTFNAGVRLDHHSRVGNECVPQFGIAFHLPSNIELKFSSAKGFRYPILREMYMFPPQNPDLKPESMWNYEVALSQRLMGGRLSYGVNAFYIDGENLIVALPNPNGAGMLNQNSGDIRNSGFELQSAFRISDSWSVDANYSFLHMEEPVIAAPESKLYAGLNFAAGRWGVSTGVQYIAGLYTAVGADERQEDFTLWNVRASFRASKWLSLWLRGDNLLAQKYEINAGYAMPKATAMAGLNINI